MRDNNSHTIRVAQMEVDPFSQAERQWQRHRDAVDVHEVIDPDINAGRNIMSNLQQFIAGDVCHNMILRFDTLRCDRSAGGKQADPRHSLSPEVFHY